MAALPADSQTQLQVRSGMWKCNSSTHSLFCKQIAPTSQEVGIQPVICSLLHGSVTQFGLEPLITSPLEGESIVLEEKRSGVQDAAAFGDLSHHFQFPRAATAYLQFPKCTDCMCSAMRDLRDAEKGMNIFRVMHSMHYLYWGHVLFLCTARLSALEIGLVGWIGKRPQIQMIWAITK